MKMGHISICLLYIRLHIIEPNWSQNPCMIWSLYLCHNFLIFLINLMNILRQLEDRSSINQSCRVNGPEHLQLRCDRYYLHFTVSQHNYFTTSETVLYKRPLVTVFSPWYFPSQTIAMLYSVLYDNTISVL